MTSIERTDSCFSFLRRIEEHVVAADRGAMPAHVISCADCARRLERARFLATELRRRPSSPSGLRRPELLESVFEASVARSESGPTGDLLRSALVPCALDRSTWPAQQLDAAVVSRLRERSVAPSWIWQRTLDRVRGVVAERGHSHDAIRTRRMRLAMGVAALVMIGAALTAVLQLGRAHVPEHEFTIVEMDRSQLPAVQLPIAMLRGEAR